MQKVSGANVLRYGLSFTIVIYPSTWFFFFLVGLGCDILHIVKYVVSAMLLCFISSMSGDQCRTLFAPLHLQRTKVQKVSGANVLRYGLTR